MQRSRIEWLRTVDPTAKNGYREGHSWNVYSGCAGPRNDNVLCSYCYGYDLAVRFNGGDFTPKFHPERLPEPVYRKKPTRIFCDSMSDLFQTAVTQWQFDAVLETIIAAPQHTFYILTKQPQNIMGKLSLAPIGIGETICNLWLGVTVTDDKMAQRTKPYMIDVGLKGWHTFVSIEPILGAINPFWLTWSDWIILGAMSGKDAAKHVPERKWLEDIITVADFDHVPVFLKDSIAKLWPDMNRHVWPKETT